MILKAIPSLLTVGNLVLGMVALILCYRDTSVAALLVVVGMVLDGLDGRVARLLHAESSFGRELDSLSDVITFGVAPALIMYQVVLKDLGWSGVCIAALFPVCGALRLARFNVQQKSTNYFVGLPITAAGGILATMALYNNVLNPAEFILPTGMLILSILMVSQVRYPNFKKIAFPRSAIVVVPLLALVVYCVFRYEHTAVNRLIFVPLAIYGLYGVGRMIRRKRSKASDAERDAEVYKSGTK